MLYDPRAPFSSSLPARFGTDWEPVFPPLDGPSSRRDPDYWRKIVLEFSRRVVQKAPVDTGRARGNWQVELGFSTEAVLDEEGLPQTVKSRARNRARNDDRPADGVMREDWILDDDCVLFVPAFDEQWNREASEIAKGFLAWRGCRSLWLPNKGFPLTCDLLLLRPSVVFVEPHRKFRGIRLCLKSVRPGGVVVNGTLVYRSPPNES